MKHIKFLISVMLSILFSFPYMQLSAFATDAEYKTDKPVKVAVLGYPNYITFDADGNPYGYAYEYLCKIAEYTGWEYEYISANFTQAHTMLENGEIDIVAGTQFTSERAEKCDYSEYDIGWASTLICVNDNNDKYAYNDIKSLNGIKLGSIKNSRTITQTTEYFDAVGISCELKTYDSDELSKQALASGEIDALLMSSIRSENGYKVIAKLYSNQVYLTSNKNRPELKKGIDYAIKFIHADNNTYEAYLENKYFGKIKNSLVFTSDELDYIKKSGKIGVAFNEDSAPYSYVENGEIKGISVEIMKLISEKSGLEFEYSMAKSEEAPVKVLSDESDNITLFCGLMQSEMNLIANTIQLSDSYFENRLVMLARKDEAIKLDSDAKFAIQAEYINGDVMLKSMYPDVKQIRYNSCDDAMEALTTRFADYMFIDEYTANIKLQNPRFSELTVVDAYQFKQQASIGMLDGDNTVLMSIINKCISELEQEKINSLITEYATASKYSLSLGDTIYKYRVQILIVVYMLIICFALLILYITTKRKSEQKLKANNAKLNEAVRSAEEANKYKSDFLSRVSHDMKTPMNAILGLSDLAQREVSDKKAVGDYLKKIDISSHYLLHLINDILEMSKLENQKITLHPEPVNALKFVNDTIDVLMPVILDKNLKFVANKEEFQEFWINIDPQRCRQVLVNILNNSIKFTKSGGTISLIGKIISTDDNKLTGKIIISDTGVGMSKEFLPNLFKPFEQENQKRVDNHDGTGLGMSIAKSLIELMGGTIEVESQLNVGTTFTIDFMFDIVEPADNKNSDNIVAEKDVSGRGKRILVVEDNEINSEITVKILENCDFKCETAMNGQEAIDKFAKTRKGYYDAILMDIRMPVMDGIKATSIIRHLNRPDVSKIPIIALSADAQSVEDERLHADGFTAFITKPISPSELCYAVEEAIKHSKFS